MKRYYEKLKNYFEQAQPEDGETILEMLYEYHNANHPYDNEQIKADFNALYEAMHGMPLREIDRVIYTVCTLCRDHEKTGFAEGVKMGIQLVQEISDNESSISKL